MKWYNDDNTEMLDLSEIFHWVYKIQGMPEISITFRGEPTIVYIGEKAESIYKALLILKAQEEQSERQVL